MRVVTVGIGWVLLASAILVGLVAVYSLPTAPLPRAPVVSSQW